MPVLPTIKPLRGLGGVPDYGRVNAAEFGAGTWGEIGNLAEVYSRIQDAADKSEAAMLTQTTAAQIDGAIQAAKDTHGDPDEFLNAAKTDVQSIYDSTVGGARNDRVKGMVQNALGDNLVKATTNIQHHAAQMRVSQTKVNYDLMTDDAAKRYAATDDPVEQAKILGDVSRITAELRTAGVFQGGEDRVKLKQFHDKVLTESAFSQIETNPDQALTDLSDPAGRYGGLTSEKRLSLATHARTQIEGQDRTRERVFKQVGDVVMRDLQIAANNGTISPNDMKDLLDGRNPYIKPEQARALNEVNSNPPTGGNDQQIKAIMAQYRLTPGRTADVQRAMNQLNSIGSQMTAPSKVFLDFANELQSDLYRAENTGIARANQQTAEQTRLDNKAIHNLQNEYDAWVQAQPPWVKNLVGNLGPQQKAQLESIYRNSGTDAAKKKLDDFIKGTQQKIDKVPAPNKKVLEQVR